MNDKEPQQDDPGRGTPSSQRIPPWRMRHSLKTCRPLLAGG